jgi:hypothetical protein
MAVRVTAAEVRLILETELSNAEIEAFIADASLWVDQNLVGACTAVTDDILKAVEKYLAAHMITARDALLRASKLQDVSETYQRDEAVSEYLRIAISLDPCGVVSEKFLDQENKRSVRFRVGEGFDDDLDLPTD